MTEIIRIQKLFRRLKVLFTVFAALCFVLSLFAVAAAIIRGVEGDSYLSGDGFLSRVAEALDFGEKDAALGLFIMDAISFFALGFLLTATVFCLRAEKKEGTPFSERGARGARTLGMLYFFVSLATETAAVIMRESFSVTSAESIGVVGGMATGVTLLVMSSLIRYGTRLQDMLMLKDVPMPEPELTVEAAPEEGETDFAAFTDTVSATPAEEESAVPAEPERAVYE